MKKTLCGLIVLALANLMLCKCSGQTPTQPKAFTDWPAGLSPMEGGVSKQSIEETKTALRELGLKDDLQ